MIKDKYSTILTDEEFPLRVTPNKIMFESIEPGTLYVMTFSIKNATQSSHRVRISNPRSKYFALNYIPAGALAPGLDLRAEIECQLPDDSHEVNFRDAVTIIMGPYSLDLPLFAYKSGPIIVHDTILNFGQVIEGVPKTIKSKFCNKGFDIGTVKITLPDDSCFKANPFEFDLPPGDEKIVQFKAESNILGPIREIARIDVSNVPDSLYMDISAQIVVQSVSLVSANKSGVLDNLDFGYLFFGEVRDTEAFLVNNSPTPLAFLVSFENEENQAKEENRSVSIIPSEGILSPYAQLPLIIKYHPIVPSPTKGFIAQHLKDHREPSALGCKPIFQIPETGQEISLNVFGAPCLPDYTVTPKILRFGQCAVYERRDILLTFTNNSMSAMSLFFSETAHFKISPSKVVVQGRQAKTFIVSFMPTQMGKFKSIMTLSVGNISSFQLKMIGETNTNSMGEKRTLLGGPEALPSDFKKKYHFVDPKEVAAQRALEKSMTDLKLTRFPQEIESSSLSEKIYNEQSLLLDQTDNVDFDYILKKKQNKTVYNTYLQSSLKSRIKKINDDAKKSMISSCGYDRSDPFGKDMGIERGLDEPDLKIPTANEPLWLSNRNEESDGSRKITFDENRLIQKKHPPLPITPVDIRDCATEINFEASKSVVCSHKLIQFGRVSVNSKNMKNFAFFNSLQRSVLIELHGMEDELSESKPLSQVVPPGAMAGFDVALSSREVGKYHGSFSWTINGHMITKVGLSADIVPLEITLDHSFVKLEFLESSLEKSVEQDIILFNPGNAPAEFLWGAMASFKVSPDRGIVEARQSFIVKLIWSPKPELANEAELNMHVIGGIDQILKAVGNIRVGKCTFKEKSLALGPMAVGTEYSFDCKIKNVGKETAIFMFEDIPENLGISLDIYKGSIAPGKTISIKIFVCPHEKMSYSSKLSVSIRGGKTIHLDLLGEAIFPQLHLEETNYNYGQIAIGNELILPLTVTNTGTIASSAILNLKDHPDFFLCLIKNYDVSLVDQINRKDIDELSDYNGNYFRVIKENHLYDELKVSSRIWTFSIKPGTSIYAGLVFRPQFNKHYSFQLPLQIPGLKDSKLFHRDVKAFGCTSRISLSSFLVDFGDRIVSRDPINKMSFFKEIQLSSNDKEIVNYELREIDESDSDSANHENQFGQNQDANLPPVFFISPLKGELSPRSTIPIRFTFMPGTNISYQKKLGIYLSDQNDPKRPYLTIICRGSGIFPRLTFDMLNISLPIVPLKVTSRKQFYIFNNGYENIEIKYRVSPTIPVPIELTFPDGMELGYSIEKIRVIISFVSETSVSWMGKLEFYDNDGEKFALELNGCSDNCIFTNTSFVRSYKENYNFLGLDDQPVFYLTKSDILIQKQKEAKKKELLRKQRALERQRNAEPGSKSSEENSSKSGNKVNLASNELTFSSSEKSPEGIDPTRESEFKFTEESRKEVSYLLKWLNSFVCKSPIDIDNFPHCIIETNGNLVIDCIEIISGKKIPLKSINTKNETTNNPMESAKSNLAKMNDIIQFLVKSGAMLSHINVSYFLTSVEYLINMEIELKRMEGNRCTPSMIVSKKVTWEAQWLDLSSYAWSELLFQVIKVFGLSRINYSIYKTTPGVLVFEDNSDDKVDSKNKTKNNSKAPPELKPSNVYSHSEAVLLLWSYYHTEKASKLIDGGNHNPSKSNKSIIKRFIDFDSDFNDLISLCSIIHSHVPEATHEGKFLHGYTSVDRNRKDECFKFLKLSCNQLKFDFDFNPEEFLSSPRTKCLLLLHLFLSLPSLIPKSTLEFRGKIGDPITKIIELKNPSKKRIAYKVQLDADKDFSMNSTQVYLDPESTVDFNVTLQAKFSKKIVGQIIFWGVRESGYTASNLVFRLESNIIGRKPVSVLKKVMSLFEVETFTINFNNPFPKECNFIVKIENSSKPTDLSNFIPKLKQNKGVLAKGKQNINSNNLETSEDDVKLENVFNNPIWTAEEKFSIPYQGSRTMVLNAAPFKLGTYTCQVILIDNTYGEFSQEINLEVVLPKPERIDFECNQSNGASVTKLLKISSKNLNFEKCLSFVLESRLDSSKRVKGRTFIQNMIASNITDQESCLSTFCAEIISPYFKCPDEFKFVSEYIPIVVNTGNKKINKISKTFLDNYDHGTIDNSPNSLLISVFPEKAGTYTSKLLVYSKSNEKDVRSIEFTLQVVSIDTNPVLEFKGPSRTKIVQKIPISNDSETDWLLSANIVGKSFSGPKSLSVSKGTKENFELTFYESKPGKHEGTLSLKDPAHGDTFNFKLVGITEDPLAEDNIHFRCKARKREVCKIPIRIDSINKKQTNANVKKISDGKEDESSKKIVLNVQTDLPHVSGLPTLEVDIDMEHSFYELVVFSPVGGQMSGSITFTDNSSGYQIWYTVDIEVTSPEAEGVFELETQVRKAAAVDIMLDNSSDYDILFDVQIEGDGLIGESTYLLQQGNLNKPYELLYSPLVAGKFYGSIRFLNSQHGEFWYDITMNALPAPIISLGCIEAMLGDSGSIQVLIENPLPHPVDLSHKITDEEHFSVRPERLPVTPFGSILANIFFKPSSLGDAKFSIITFFNEEFGEILYEVKGVGLLPGIMNTINISSQMNEMSSNFINFRNPFSHQLPIDIILSCDESDVFSLVTKKNKGSVIPAKAVSQIGISFKPQKLCQYKATIEVRSLVSGRELLWCYPILGIAEIGPSLRIPKIVTRCKTSYLRETEIPLIGLRKENISPDEELSALDFSFEVKVSDHKYQSLIDRAFRVQIIDVVEIKNDDKCDFGLKCKLLFEPLKMFTTSLEIKIIGKNRGHWILSVEVESTEQTPDDIINLKASVGKSDKISFKLSNRFLGFSAFEAFFTGKSSNSFSVSPSSGVLAPFGSDGSQFLLTYSPTEYGIGQRATLMIVTDDAQWSYEVRGTFPEHKIENIDIKSKIDTRR